jgi:hypothetical protein
MLEFECCCKAQNVFENADVIFNNRRLVFINTCVDGVFTGQFILRTRLDVCFKYSGTEQGLVYL